jgi:hypothetical protein
LLRLSGHKDIEIRATVLTRERHLGSLRDLRETLEDELTFLLREARHEGAYGRRYPSHESSITTVLGSRDVM